MKSRVFFCISGIILFIILFMAGQGMAQIVYLGYCGTNQQKECPNLNQLEECRGGDPRWLHMDKAIPGPEYLAVSHNNGTGGWYDMTNENITIGIKPGMHVWGIPGTEDQYGYNTHLHENPPTPENAIPMHEVNPGGKLAYLQQDGTGVWLYPWEDPPPLPETAIYTQSELDQAVEEERNSWDVDGDGKMGMAEVIRALQVLTAQ
jgi:hypothetical protein